MKKRSIVIAIAGVMSGAALWATSALALPPDMGSTSPPPMPIPGLQSPMPPLNAPVPAIAPMPTALDQCVDRCFALTAQQAETCQSLCFIGLN